VVMFFPETCDTGVEQERTGDPSTWTVQAPQSPAPQPNFVPVSCSVSRRTQSNGVSGDTLTFFSLALMRNVKSAMILFGRGVRFFPTELKTGEHPTQVAQKVKPGES
jgi:hypothetical protein